MSADQNAAASGVHCRCGGNLAKHKVPGFDGACIRCDRCLSFRPRLRESAPHRVPVSVPAGERHLVASAWIDGLVAEIEAGPHRRVPAVTRRSRRA
jgi:hypothetical protein